MVTSIRDEDGPKSHGVAGRALPGDPARRTHGRAMGPLRRHAERGGRSMRMPARRRPSLFAAQDRVRLDNHILLLPRHNRRCHRRGRIPDRPNSRSRGTGSRVGPRHRCRVPGPTSRLSSARFPLRPRFAASPRLIPRCSSCLHRRRPVRGGMPPRFTFASRGEYGVEYVIVAHSIFGDPGVTGNGFRRCRRTDHGDFWRHRRHGRGSSTPSGAAGGRQDRKSVV